MGNLESIALLVISFMLKNFEVVTIVLGLSCEFHFVFFFKPCIRVRSLQVRPNKGPQNCRSLLKKTKRLDYLRWEGVIDYGKCNMHRLTAK
jgi:hypothetical protein